MADDADIANDIEQRRLQANIDASQAAVPGLSPVGECHNCGYGVGPDQLYCDAECADDHAWILHRLRLNGRA